MYRVILHGEKRLHDLASWGVVPRKSLSVDGPDITKIDKDILYYVIRGIIDGDGWIRKDGREFFICSASKKFIDWCENTLSYLGFSNMNKKFIPNGYNGIYHLRSARRENIALLKKFIYDKPFGMNRKYNKLH